MSRAPSKYMPSGAMKLTAGMGKPLAPSAGIQVTISSNLYSVMSSVASARPLLRYGLQHRFYDLITHHRLSVLKNNKFPGKRDSQKFLAANYFRATRSTDEGGGMKVEALGRMNKHATFDTSGVSVLNYFPSTETGAKISSRAPMLIPIGKRVAGFWQKVKDRKFVLIRRKNLPWLLVEPVYMGRARKDGTRSSNRTRLVAVLGFARTQRPILGFYGQLRRVLPTHQKKMDRMLDRMMTAAGRKAIGTEMAKVASGTADTFTRKIKTAEADGDRKFKAEATAIERAFDSKGGI